MFGSHTETIKYFKKNELNFMLLDELSYVIYLFLASVA